MTKKNIAAAAISVLVDSIAAAHEHSVGGQTPLHSEGLALLRSHISQLIREGTSSKQELTDQGLRFLSAVDDRLKTVRS